TDKWAYLFLGGVYVETGRADLAAPLLQRVLELDPTDATARQQLDQLADGDGS
ncbi:MAG: tetratricopeptide repeat protein, partial [Candidatus Promineofilum sp.]|nr:tetratricopeptide repeat protein [Promineifilum sp.]